MTAQSQTDKLQERIGAQMTKIAALKKHNERLAQWLENWLLPTLSGNEAVVLRQQIAEARSAGLDVREMRMK